MYHILCWCYSYSENSKLNRLRLNAMHMGTLVFCKSGKIFSGV